MRLVDDHLDPQDAAESSLQEHLARYRFAREQARGRVLDVACGIGYGTAMLGAVGVDLRWETLWWAFHRYPASYVAADALRLPFGRAFDTIVSFETIEHIEDPEGFVAECARVLRPGGILILSTPNRELVSPHSKRPYFRHHRREFNRKEFVQVLRPFRVRLYGQRFLDPFRATAYQWREMGKRIFRPFVPIRRLRPRFRYGLEGIRPNPVYEVVPWSDGTPVSFVALAEL